MARPVQELFRAVLRDDQIELTALRPFATDVPLLAAWAMALADIFHHVIDATAEFEGLDRVRTTAALRDALASIDRAPHVGPLRTFGPQESLPDSDTDALQLVVAHHLPNGRIEMRLGGLGWSEEMYLQWSQLVFDLTHAVARLESLDVGALRESVLREIDRPSTLYQGNRSRIANVLPKGLRPAWDTIPRVRDGARELCTLDLALIARAPIEGLEVCLELMISYDEDARGLPTDEEEDRLHAFPGSAWSDLDARDLVFAARTIGSGHASFLVYVSSAEIAARVVARNPEARGKHSTDQSWSRFLELRPDRDELRRLANWDWLDALVERGHDVRGPATIHHVFWPPSGSDLSVCVASLSRAGLTVLRSSDDESGRPECVVEQHIDRLVDSIDEVTRELDELALEIGVTYDGWDLAR